MPNRSGSPDQFPQLVDAEGEIQPDDLMFRVGSFRLRLEIDGQTFYAHSASLTYSLSKMPVCSVNLGIGDPAGPKAATIPDAAKTLADYAGIKKLQTARVYLTVEEFDPGDEPLVGPALKPGEYLAFDGVVDGLSLQREGQSAVALKVRIAHAATARLSAGTSAFGPLGVGGVNIADTWNPVTDNDPAAAKRLYLPEEPDLGRQFRAVVSNILSAYQDGLEAERNAAPSIWATFEEMSETNDQRLQQALDSLVFGVRIRDVLSSDITRINKYLGALTANGWRNHNLLGVLNTIGQQVYTCYISTARQSYVFPYWPHRAISEMKALRAGSYFFTNFGYAALGSNGTFIAGTLVRGQLTSTTDAETANPTPIGAYLWPLTEEERQFASVQVMSAPGWAFYGESPITQTVGDSQQTLVSLPTRKDYPRLVPMGGPSGPGSENVQRLNPKGSVGGTVLGDQLARFYTLEHMLGPAGAKIVTPLRWDITPGKVLRLDQYRLGGGPSSPENAVYGHVTRVDIALDGEGYRAHTAVSLSHLHDHDQQQKIEQNEVGPFLYETDYYQDLNDLQLFEEAGDDEEG